MMGTTIDYYYYPWPIIIPSAWLQIRFGINIDILVNNYRVIRFYQYINTYTLGCYDGAITELHNKLFFS